MPVLELPLLLDGSAAWRIPLGGSQLQRVPAVEIEHRLHETLPEARLAKDERAVVILKRAGDNFGRGGRVLVRENDEGSGRQGRIATRHVRLCLAVPCADRRDLLTVLEEQIADREALIEDTAGIAAEVEHNPADVLLLQSAHGILNFLRGGLVEAIERDVADPIAVRPERDRVAHRGHMNDRAREMNLDGI